MNGNNKPVATEFERFDREHTGNAVNARGDRMDTALHSNAEQLDDAVADRGDEDTKDRRDRSGD